MMIPEREREALMRLTMCARGECPMCKYEEQCDNWDFRMELATKNMNILADALRKTEPQTCDDCIWSVCNYNKVFDFFRNPTAEERKAVADYIDSISVPTGVNVFDLMDEPQTEHERALEQREHDILYEPTYDLDDGSM